MIQGLPFYIYHPKDVITLCIGGEWLAYCIFFELSPIWGTLLLDVYSWKNLIWFFAFVNLGLLLDFQDEAWYLGIWVLSLTLLLFQGLLVNKNTKNWAKWDQNISLIKGKVGLEISGWAWGQSGVSYSSPLNWK